MRSFRKTAQIYEEEEEVYDKRLWVDIHRYERRFIDQCFSEERTKDWSNRLAEYWQHHEAKAHPIDNFDLRRDRCLPDGRESGSLYQKFHAVGLSDLLGECRKARIGTEFHGFMQLPRELRNLVYSHLVVTGSRFVITHERPNDRNAPREDIFEDYDGDIYQRYLYGNKERPLRGRVPDEIANFRDEGGYSRASRLGTMNLLRGVSCTIQREVSELFFSQNQLVFSAGNIDYPMGFNRVRSRDYWLDYSSLSRDVSYTFDMRDSVTKDIENRYRSSFGRDIDEGLITREEALLKLHDQKTRDLELRWVDRIEAIKKMSLNRLQLSFEECYCSIGCCRKVAWVLDGFVYDDVPPGRSEEDIFCDKGWATHPPRVIEVFGWRSEKEKTLIQEKLGQLRSLEAIEVHLIEDTRTEDDKTTDYFVFV